MTLRTLALTAAFLPVAAAAQTTGAPADAVFSAADIEAAGFSGQDLPSGRSPLTAKVQILLDRAGTSPGVVDGFKGGMSESAIMAFERRAGLVMDGRLDQQVWDLLLPYSALPLTQDYTITEADAQGLVDAIPVDYAEKAQMETLAYTSIAEKLGERFHMDEKFIAFLNPGVTLVPGATIKVTTAAPPIKGEVTRILVDKATRRVAGYDAAGQMVVDYPATIGSDATPSPSGTHTVLTIAMDPNYTYNPNINFKQGDNDKVLTIPPGPNGPVGTVWIDLSKPTYGIHGTPTPSQLFRNQSNGCVRLTNWDAEELSKMVKPGVTQVEFLAPGVTIADATGVTQPAAAPAADPAAPGAVATTPPATAPGTPPATTEPAVAASPSPAGGTAPAAPTWPAAPSATTASGIAPLGTVPDVNAPAPLPDAAVAPLPDGAVAPLPANPAGAAAADVSGAFEDTTEPADPSGAVVSDDPLLDALNHALKEQPLVPPAADQP